MFTIEAVVRTILFLLGAGAVFGLLLFLIDYCEGQFPRFALFCKFARIFLVICGVLVLIGMILDLMGHPLVVWR